MLRHLHLTAIGIDIAEILVELVLLHVDAADDAQRFARLIGIGIGGHEVLQVGQGLVILVVVVINHADLHHRLTRVTRTRPVFDETVEVGDGRAFVAMHEVGIAYLEQSLLIIRCARITLQQIIEHADLLVHITFRAIAEALLEEGVVGVALPDTRGQIIIIDGLVVAAFHEVAVAKANISVRLEVVFAVISQADETPEALGSSIVVGLLVVDVAQVIVGETVFGQTRGGGHALKLGEVFARLVMVAHLVSRLTHPKAGSCLVGSRLLAIHDLGEIHLRLVVIAFLEVVDTRGIEQIIVNRLQFSAFLFHRL